MELLEQHFDAAFAAPDGIKKLRELILKLAMQGKLVPQDPKDPPVSQLLKEIEAEKKRLVKEGKIKAPKALPPITPEEMPYALPQGWEWVRLGGISDYNGRDNIGPESIAADTWLLDLEDIEKDTSRLLYRAKYSERQSKSTKSKFQKGDVLYGKLRPYLDKVIVADAEGVCTTEIVPIVPSIAISSEFLRWLLKRPAFLANVNSLMYGVKMPRLGTEDAVQSIHPLPSLPEQHRIIAKIDQLMARCDELETLRTEREQKRRSVHTAALKQLLNAQASDSFADAWQFITQHFGELYAVPENVTELRKAILQLAVMGKLVPQNPQDPPASQLLTEIEAEKKRLVKEGKIKAPKPLPKIKEEEAPYELPPGWEWVRLGTVTEIKGGKRVSNGYRLLDTPTPYIYIRVSDMKNGSIDDSDLHYIDDDMRTKIKQYIITKNDIYMTIVGATIGKCGVVPEKFDGMNLTENAARLILPKMLDRIFLFHCLNSRLCQKQFIDKTKQVGVQKMALNRLARTFISLPPLDEQHRIVTKIDQLMTLCDALERCTDDAISKQTELLNAVMARV